MLLILAHVVSTTDDLEETGRVLDERMEIWTFGCLLMQHLMHCNELCDRDGIEGVLGRVKELPAAHSGPTT